MAHQIEINSISGLSESEASVRLKQAGYNELPSTQNRSMWKIALESIQEPIFLLLVGCGAIYLFLGDAQEALILLGFVFLIVGINLYQEQKTEKSLEALRDLSSPRALVIRDGERQRIAGREVVSGDIVVLAEGDRVSADAVVLWSTQLSVDESLLTGESLPVRKRAVEDSLELELATQPSRKHRPGGDDFPFVYSGTLVVQGQGIAQVYATGLRTEMGKIGKALQTVEPEDTVLEKETRRIVGKLTIVAIAICIAVIVIYGITRSDWLQGFLAGLALAMAILPNEIPVVLAIFLALGAWRFSLAKVLTRRIPVVETLGSATVLCVDKTGTLTFNCMSIQQLFVYQPSPHFYDVTLHEREPLPEAFHELIEFGILASRKDPFDPMEKALKQVGDDYLAKTEHLHYDWEILREYPLSGKLLAMSCVWQSPEGKLIIAAKGAPEAIADLCHFDIQQMQDLEKHISTMATAGLRVLGVAKAIGRHKSDKQQNILPDKQHDFEFQFLGLVGMADPVRPTVALAIAECYHAGIRVVMITGDYPATAQNIARQIGLQPSTEAIAGTKLEQMTESELLTRIQTVNIFARVVPEQKLLIVNALKRYGEIVAMTGDGVNDAPALKSAHIGIAMGERGTDVARESADLVLLNDDFSSIVRSVRLGRRVFDNLKKGMAYTLAVHVPIAGMSLIPVMFHWPLVLLPIHIAFLHLIIDPACTVVFEAEPEESNIMNRPPRNPKQPLFNRHTLRLALLQGVSVLVVLLLVFAIAFYSGHGELDARALAFTTLIVSNLSMILTNRSWSRTIPEMLRTPNPALWWVLGGGVVFLGLVLYVPLLRHLFRFSFLHFDDLIVSLASGLFSILWFEGLKIWQRRKGFV
ncbi:cation-translocating P-type ATPase [Nostocaceae cyanobacterium CENA369]|uniref:P-type Cu(+) transporter n=1 Tax=Dendronalium phyllosphericum CENA369 TaxID=1725256 RepID=A0A8J7ID93_9NOST|nr:cation-translocating P-type ATPase [Dendronalium phyllosphericum]MBH8577990.1 cation-translocating P-type ATPase [Dendronalium phyllosphericum CENA369]